MTDKVKVVIGDDHPLFREALVRALAGSSQVEVVGEAGDGMTALQLIRTHQPEVAVLDYRMPGMDGAGVVAALHEQQLPTRVLLLSAHGEPSLVYRVLAEGAAGFLSKESTRAEILTAVLECADGRHVLSPTMTAGLAREIRRHAQPAGRQLTARERQVLELIASGHSIAEIAEKLYLSPSTIKTYTHRLYEKLGVGDRASAVAEAMRNRLLE